MARRYFRRQLLRFNRLSAIRRLVVGLVGLLLVVGILELTNTTHLFHKQQAISGPIPIISQKSSEPSPATPTANTKGGSAGASSSNVPTPSATTNLVAPSGIFVSNHHPGTNGTPGTEASNCNTTPGATCYIKLEQNGVVKTLPNQKVDSSGTTSWTWDISSAGLTTGAWQVTAVSTLGSQTKSTADPVALEVQ